LEQQFGSAYAGLVGLFDGVGDRSLSSKDLLGFAVEGGDAIIDWLELGLKVVIPPFNGVIVGEVLLESNDEGLL
jgi:hypothetical protein